MSKEQHIDHILKIKYVLFFNLIDAIPILDH